MLVNHLVFFALIFLWELFIYLVVFVADQVHLLCYIDIWLTLEFHYFSCFLKCCIFYVLHLHNFHLSFVYVSNSWKCRVVLLAVWVCSLGPFVYAFHMSDILCNSPCDVHIFNILHVKNMDITRRAIHPCTLKVCKIP